MKTLVLSANPIDGIRYNDAITIYQTVSPGGHAVVVMHRLSRPQQDARKILTAMDIYVQTRWNLEEFDQIILYIAYSLPHIPLDVKTIGRLTHYDEEVRAEFVGKCVGVVSQAILAEFDREWIKNLLEAHRLHGMRLVNTESFQHLEDEHGALTMGELVQRARRGNGPRSHYIPRSI